METLDVDVERHAEIRREPTHFFVRPGHVYPEVEKIIGEEPQFVIVERIGDAGRVAEAADRTQSDA